MKLTDSEVVAYQYLKAHGLDVVHNNKSPDFLGDGAYEAKKVYLDRHGQCHVVLNASQFRQIHESFPNAKYLLVNGSEVTEVPIESITQEDSLVLRVNGKSFTVHWNPRLVKDVSKILRIEFDDEEVSRIQTVKTKLGMKSTPELFRVMLMEKFNIVTGSPPPNGKKR